MGYSAGVYFSEFEHAANMMQHKIRDASVVFMKMAFDGFNYFTKDKVIALINQVDNS